MTTIKKVLLGLTFSVLMAATTHSPAGAADVICYNCPPQWADWASMLKAVKADLGYDIPFDNKNSGQTLSQLLAEKDNPVADIAYYGINFGMKAKTVGVVEPLVLEAPIVTTLSASSLSHFSISIAHNL